MITKTKRIGDAVHISGVSSVMFNWPSGNEAEIWRHVTNYELYNADTLLYESLEVYRGTNRKIILRGFLLSNPDCQTRQMLVEIPITSYSIDFGISLDDVNRGFWLNGEDGVWYKLEQALSDYYSTALPCLNLFSQYLKFYDAIVYGCGNQSGQTLVKKVKRTGMFTCAKDIATIHRFSNEYFDFDAVKKNASFFLSNSTSAFEADCGMMKSLERYQNLQLMKGSSSELKRPSGTTAADAIPMGGRENKIAGVTRVSALDDSFGDTRKRKKKTSKPSRSDISSANASDVNGHNGKKRLVKVADTRVGGKRPVVYDISDDDSSDEEDRKLGCDGCYKGFIKERNKKKIKIEKQDGVSTASAPSSSLANSKDNRIPRALIEKRSTLTPSAAEQEGSSSMQPARAPGTSAVHSNGILGGLGTVAAGAAASSLKSKGLKPDWLIRQEKTAEERERNKRFDTLQALGFTNRDPKAKLHGHRHSSRPAHLPEPDKNAVHISDATSTTRPNTSTNLPLQYHSHSPTETGDIDIPRPPHSAGAASDFLQPLLPLPVPTTSHMSTVSTTSSRRLRWADQLEGGRLWTMNYIEDPSFAAGEKKADSDVGLEKWHRSVDHEVEDAD